MVKNTLIIGACALIVGATPLVALTVRQSSRAEVQAHEASTLAAEKTKAKNQADAQAAAQQQQIKAAALKQCQADLKLYLTLPQTTRDKYKGPVCVQ